MLWLKILAIIVIAGLVAKVLSQCVRMPALDEWGGGTQVGEYYQPHTRYSGVDKDRLVYWVTFIIVSIGLTFAGFE